MPTKTVPTDLSAIFELAAATPIEGHDSEWVWLTKDILKLSLIHIPAVQETLKQGRWRNAKNQKAYIKTVAKREAAGMKLLDDPTENLHLKIPNLVDEDGKRLGHDAYIDYLSYDGPVKEGGVWHEGSGSDYDPDEYTENGERLSPGERLINRIPAEFKAVEEIPADLRQEIEKLNAASDDTVYFPTDPIEVPDWEKIALTASLDEGEQFVLSCKITGVSRERALDGQTPVRRKWIQAAWRRFDRTGVEKLRVVMLTKA